VLYGGGMYWFYRRRSAAAPRSIRIVELAQTLCYGGLERMVHSLARSLHRDERYNVLVVTYDDVTGFPSLEAQFEKDGIPLIQWRKKKGFSLRSILRLVQIIFSQKVRI